MATVVRERKDNKCTYAFTEGGAGRRKYKDCLRKRKDLLFILKQDIILCYEITTNSPI